MKRVILSILLMSVLVNAQLPDNFKWRNFIISSFGKDSTKYTPAFNVADFENLTVHARFDDSSSAGFSGDSCAFVYFFQEGYLTYKSTGTYDTAWKCNVLLIDTINTTAGNFRDLLMQNLATDGTYADSLKMIDTSSVSGFASSMHSVSPNPCMFGRVGMQALSDIKQTGFIKVSIDIYQRRATKVNTREVVDYPGN